MPSIAITQPYEAVYIVDADLGDEQIGVITAKYRQIVETGGGTVEKIDVWERRKLAYEIKGRTEGIYVVMQFQRQARRRGRTAPHLPDQRRPDPLPDCPPR